MAKRFRFRLTVVLKLRQQKQDECRRVVAGRLRQVAAVQARRERLAEQLEHRWATQRRLAMPGASVAEESRADTPGVDVAGIWQHGRYANHLQQCIADAEQELVGLRTELRGERAALQEAARNVKVLEKLEERQRRRHNLTLARAERAEGDEIGAEFARRQRLALASGMGTDRRA